MYRTIHRCCMADVLLIGWAHHFLSAASFTKASMSILPFQGRTGVRFRTGLHTRVTCKSGRLMVLLCFSGGIQSNTCSPRDKEHAVFLTPYRESFYNR